MKSNIIIADSQNLYRIGLKHVLKKHFNSLTITELSTKRELIKTLNNTEIDYLFIDVNNVIDMEKRDVLNINKLFPTCRIIIITCFHNEFEDEFLYKKEISGYICKNSQEQVFYEALIKIQRNDRYICNQILNSVLENNLVKQQNDCNHLTTREIEILKLIAQGKTGNQIASILFISVHTFRTHRKNIMKKTSANSTSKLVLYALKSSIV